MLRGLFLVVVCGLFLEFLHCFWFFLFSCRSIVVQTPLVIVGPNNTTLRKDEMMNSLQQLAARMRLITEASRNIKGLVRECPDMVVDSELAEIMLADAAMDWTYPPVWTDEDIETIVEMFDI